MHFLKCNLNFLLKMNETKLKVKPRVHLLKFLLSHFARKKFELTN